MAKGNTNFIHSLMDENGRELDLGDIKSHIVAYFMKPFKDSGHRRPKWNGVQFKRISTNVRNWLERPFEEKEVKRVVWNIEDDKAPRPDGFSMAFFKCCWEVIKCGIIDIMRNFHEEAFFDLGSDVTFISLIP